MPTRSETTKGPPGDGPPCYCINLEFIDGRRVVFHVPGVQAMGGGGIDPAPGRMSVFLPDPAAPMGYRLDRARLFDDIAELAAGGDEIDVEIEVPDE